MVGDTGAVSSTYDPGLYTTTSDDAMLIHHQMNLRLFSPELYQRGFFQVLEG